MKRTIMLLTVVLSLLLVTSCSSTPTDKSWDNPEDFVLYDVTKYINTALENNQEKLIKEYGNELAEVGSTMWKYYSFTGKKPTILDVERFADGCWATVSGSLGSKGDLVYDESTFYYRFHQNRWQLAFIKTQGFDNKGNEIPGTTIEHNRDIEYK